MSVPMDSITLSHTSLLCKPDIPCAVQPFLLTKRQKEIYTSGE